MAPDLCLSLSSKCGGLWQIRVFPLFRFSASFLGFVARLVVARLVDLRNSGILRCTAIGRPAKPNGVVRILHFALGGRKMVCPRVCVSPHRGCISAFLVLLSALAWQDQQRLQPNRRNP